MPTARDKLAGKKTKLASVAQKLEDHPANLSNYDEGAFYNVPIELILPDPNQPRKYFDEQALNELSTSVAQKGVLQPVIIRRDGQDRIFLVAGERRYRAAKMAKLDKIPAILTKGNPAEIALIENLQRDDLRAIEEAEALDRMIKQHGYTHEQLAAVIGKARSTITETLSLTVLPEQIKEQCRRADNYPRRLLIEIAKQESEEKMISLFNRIKDAALKSDQVREITRQREKQRTPAAVAFDKVTALHKHLQKLEIGTIAETEKLRLLTELKALKATIDKLLK